MAGSRSPAPIDFVNRPGRRAPPSILSIALRFPPCHPPAVTVTVTEEIFDVVNDRDEVIGQRPRSEVHRLALHHRAVHVLVFDSRGHLFLQKRSLRKDCFPGTWDSSSSGHLDQGEAYDACAVRELREEIGLVLPSPPIRLFHLRSCPETGFEFVWVYRCESEGPFVLQESEIDRGEWFHPDVITGWIERRPEDFARAFVLVWNTLNRMGTASHGTPPPMPQPGAAGR